ncbi:MAG: RHS repeat-associated core domain-containing protein [Clostridia bacterium]|nr:RHS repeat-associated core domain-containing protein [Clostridia bacterium]
MINPDGTSYTYTYDNKNNLTDAESNVGVKYHMTYDGSGNVLSSEITSTDSTYNKKITSSATYQNNNNHPRTITDSRGNTTTYTYDAARGLQTGVTDALDNTTEYDYNDLNDRLEYVTSGNSTVEYDYYESGRLMGIQSPSATRYAFIYDEFGRTDEIYVEQQSLINNEYTARGLLDYSTYGNGHKIGYTYDLLDRVTEKLYNNIVKVKFRYDKFGNLYEKQDLFTNTTYRYNYDLSGRLSGVVGNNNTSLNYVYDNFNRVKKFIAKVPDNTNITEYIYGDSSVNGQKDGLIYGVKQNGTQRISYGYDALARLDTRTLNTTTPFVTGYTYHQGATANTTTTLVKTMQNGSNTYEYAYDAVGNITQIKLNGQVTESYTYDSLNQLKTETRDGKVYEYTYDNGGNIQSVKRNGSVEKDFTYDNVWTDKLTSYNGMSIVYDEIGNPTLYWDGSTLNWSNGRQLTSVSYGIYTIQYGYNADGLRTTKNDGGVITEYYWLEGTLLGEKTGNDYIIYLYDENGSPYGFINNNTYYYYVQNAQGDIVGILDASGNQIVQYKYSAWGEVLSVTGTKATTIGQKNPLRYRGYYYDSETGLYYLQSRYYDPMTCRFINADGEMSDVGGDILGYNLFAYCMNNPVNMSDPTGNWPSWSNLLKGSAWLAVGITAVCVGVSVLTCGVAAPAMVAVAAVTVGAGALTAVNGAAEIGEAFTGYNVVRDTVFSGNQKAYDAYANTTAAVAEVGTAVCGGWMAKNSPRIKAYNNIQNYNYTDTISDVTHMSRPYANSVLTQKQVIKYGKMTKDSFGYVFSAMGSVNGKEKLWRLGINTAKGLVWHWGHGF